MLWRKLLRDLGLWRAQILAIALIVACGIATLVAMQSVYESLQLTQRAYYERYRFANVFAVLTRAPESVAQRLRTIPGVADVNTRVVAEVTLDVPGRLEATTARLISIPETRRSMLNDIFVREGRYIDASSPNEVIVSEAFANANRLSVGDRLTAIINRRRFDLRIAGIGLSPEYVYEIRGGDFLPDSAHFGVLWMGRRNLAAAFDMAGSFNDVSVALAPGANRSAVIEAVDRSLSPYGGIGAFEAADQRSNRTITDELTQLRAQALVIPLVFLSVAAFLLNIALSRLIATQREQIAILKALGFSNGALARHYLISVLLVMLIGSAGGLAMGVYLGTLLTRIYASFYHFPVLEYHLSPIVVLTAIGVTGAAALIGAMSSLRSVVRLAPAEAMRPPSPAAYRPTIVERLGLGRFLSLSSRMLIRNVERKPVVSLITATAIAFAVAILVLGRYGIDAVSFLMQTQFVDGMRQDVTIAFSRPLSSAARFDAGALPGVLEVEWFRAADVEVRFNSVSRRAGIIGLEKTHGLFRALDYRLRAHDMPASGVMMSAALARILKAHAGDTVAVELLQGRRKVHSVRIASTLEDMTGLQMYMSAGELHRMLNEDATVSGAYVRIDPRLRAAFDEQIKRTPAVGFVSYRTIALDTFNRMLGETMYISISFLIGFASAIACGVIYNAGRIALSERSRELATLRIMGFSRAEITSLFLGEQFIVTLAAIPMGFVAGYGLCALLNPIYQTDLYRIPLFVMPGTYVFSAVVVLGAACGSALLLIRNINRLDLLAVLKGAE